MSLGTKPSRPVRVRTLRNSAVIMPEDTGLGASRLGRPQRIARGRFTCRGLGEIGSSDPFPRRTGDNVQPLPSFGAKIVSRIKLGLVG